jgi:DNA-binding XRE family transcriptional regulator
MPDSIRHPEIPPIKTPSPPNHSLGIQEYSYLGYSEIEYILATMDIKKTIYSAQYQTIIQNPKEARIKQGLTQRETAKHFGAGQSFISKIESGQYRLDILQLQEFATLYKKTITSFLKEK